jgi:menaquinone-9 beta-reductase
MLTKETRYDVVVVGARCAGAATALNLTRRGARVLVVDRSSYGSDALSTHALLRGAVLQLHRWGVLGRIKAAGTPAVHTTWFHYGEREIAIPIRERGGVDALYAPRRTLLDRVLVDAARESGAEIHQGVELTALRRDAQGRVNGVELTGPGHRTTRVNAGHVVGADGVRSRVAASAGARLYRACAHAGAVIFGYWAGLPDTWTAGYRWMFGHGVAGGAIPTNGGNTCVFVAFPPDQLAASHPQDRAGTFSRALGALSPELAEATARSARIGALRSFTGTPGYLRQAHGPGWALVGDAGYFKDPITAHGITDAFRDAELLARALTSGSTDAETELSLEGYQATRDRLSVDLLELSDRIASFHWTLDEVAALYDSVNQATKPELATLEGLDASADRAA